MTGPLIEYIVRQIKPIDLNLSSVKYDIQVGFPGPLGYTGSPYIYRESKVSVVHNSGMFANTNINGGVTSGSYLWNISENLKTAAVKDIDFFYQRAENYANNYFLNTHSSYQSIFGYTGSTLFSGSGITGSFYEAA